MVVKFNKSRHFLKAEKLFEKYGDIAMCLGFLIPVVRYIVPVFVGIRGVSYKKFVLISYSSALVWTATFFTLGKVFGDKILRLLALVDYKSVGIAALITVLVFILNKMFKPKVANHVLLHEQINN